LDAAPVFLSAADEAISPYESDDSGAEQKALGMRLAHGVVTATQEIFQIF
jgi:hypothetical protein